MAISRRQFIRAMAIASACERYLLKAPGWALPQQKMERPGKSQRVVILGAGLAGLVAAWELQMAGHEVSSTLAGVCTPSAKDFLTISTPKQVLAAFLKITTSP